MKIKPNEILNSTLNDIGKKFDYRKKEILFDRFKGWFDNTKFTLDNDKFMGWGRYVSDCGTLIIGTASFDGAEWLDTVRHTSISNNPYNNFVNAIAYWDKLNKKGRDFFINFYKDEIFMLKYEKNAKINALNEQIKHLKTQILNIDSEVKFLSK